MKLLKFVGGDAPQTMAGGSLTPSRLTFACDGRGGRGKATQADAPAVKAWRIETPAHAIHGMYWLLDDDNKPICALHDVCFAVPEETIGADTDAADTTARRCATPHGVSDDHVTGVDLRSKLGQQLERARHEYGTTYKTASKSAHMLMNAEELSAKRHERQKRTREAVTEALETGVSLHPQRTRSATVSGKERRDGAGADAQEHVASATTAEKRSRRATTRR